MGFDEDIPQNAPQRTIRPIEVGNSNDLIRNSIANARNNFLSNTPAQLNNYSQQHPNTLPERFLDPNQARELANATLRSCDRVFGPNDELIRNQTEIQARHSASNVLADLERELRRYIPEQIPGGRELEGIARGLILGYLQARGDAASQKIVHAAEDQSLTSEQRAEMQNAGLGMGLANAIIQNQFGDSQAQQRFLIQTSQKLANDQQREDMLQAALNVGFAANAVFAAANLSGIGNRPSALQQGNTIAQTLAQTASERARELMTNMREHLDEARTDQTKMEDFELDRRALARLVGEGPANRIAKQLQTQDGQNDRAVLDSIREQVELSRRLHEGELEIRIGRVA